MPKSSIYKLVESNSSRLIIRPDPYAYPKRILGWSLLTVAAVLWAASGIWAAATVLL